MKLIYSNQNPALVANIKNMLEAADIACIVRNEYASGGVGELSFIDAWPEIWVLHDANYEAAYDMINALQARLQSTADNWICPQCHEKNDSSFEVCWQCGSEQ